MCAVNLTSLPVDQFRREFEGQGIAENAALPTCGLRKAILGSPAECGTPRNRRNAARARVLGREQPHYNRSLTVPPADYFEAVRFLEIWVSRVLPFPACCLPFTRTLHARFRFSRVARSCSASIFSYFRCSRSVTVARTPTILVRLLFRRLLAHSFMKCEMFR